MNAEIKEHLAKEKGFPSWREYVLDVVMDELTKTEDPYQDDPHDEVANRYAEKVAIAYVRWRRKQGILKNGKKEKELFQLFKQSEDFKRL